MSHTGGRQRSLCLVSSVNMRNWCRGSIFFRIAQVLALTSARVLRIQLLYIHVNVAYCIEGWQYRVLIRISLKVLQNAVRFVPILATDIQWLVTFFCSSGVFIIICILRTAAIWFYCLSPIFIWLLLSGCEPVKWSVTQVTNLSCYVIQCWILADVGYK